MGRGLPLCREAVNVFYSARRLGNFLSVLTLLMILVAVISLTDEMKRSFFQAAVVSILLYGCTTWTLTKGIEKKIDGNYKKNAASNIEQVMEATPHKAPTIRPATSHHENYPS